MALGNHEIRTLVRQVAGTDPDEIGCDDCLAEVGAYAEQKLAGREIHDALRLVADHVRGCPECREEFEGLLTAMKALVN